MTHNSTHTRWLRLGLLIALLVVTGMLPHTPAPTQAQGGGSISYGAKVFDTISEDTPRVTYSFTGGAGDVITVIADNWTGTLDLRAELIAPNGEIIGSSVQNTLDDNMQGAYLAAVLPDDGIYLLWITSENATTGDFALTLLGHPAPDSTELIFGKAVDVPLTPAADPQLFWFEAQDCPTMLVVTNLRGAQPFSYPFAVKVYDQRGQTVALLRGGEELEDWVTVTPRSGRYEVEVSSDDLLESGNVRLLVTCAADAPGCPLGQAGMSGVASGGPLVCPPCWTPDDPPDSGGCPDLHFRAESFPLDDALRVTVTWDAMMGATGYSVTVYGRYPEGGEVYLTHGTWTPGDPTSFTWFLPTHFAGFRFMLRVAIGDDVVCVEHAEIELETPPDERRPVCDIFTVDGTIADLETRDVTWTWTAYPGAEAYVAEWFEVLDDDTEALQGSVLLGPGTTSFSTTLPAPSASRDTWRFRVRVQLGGAFPCVAEDTLGFIHRIPVCVEFTLVETVHTGTSSTIIWSAYPDAEGYMLSVLDETGEIMIPPFPQLLPPDQLSYVLELPPGNYLVRVGPWMGATFCEEELALTFEPDMVCDIRTDRRDVPMRTGPGLGYSIFGYMPLDTDVRVIGETQDASGIRWWQIDPAQIGGGVGVMGGLWVQQDHVTGDPICGQVPGVQIPPPELPVQPEQPEVPVGPGQWLPCGSCDTCGHPANECVTSPEGECLWDPATCVGPAPSDGGQCYSLTVQKTGCQGGWVDVVTPTNCDGLWLPGSTVNLTANTGQCKLFNGWSGSCPGASGSNTSITITMTSSCTVIADFY